MKRMFNLYGAVRLDDRPQMLNETGAFMSDFQAQLSQVKQQQQWIVGFDG